MHCQAKNSAGTVIYDQTGARQETLSNAINAINATGGKIRYQETDLSDWTILKVAPGSGYAVQDRELEW